MLHAMADVLILIEDEVDGQMIVLPVEDQSTAHLERLITNKREHNNPPPQQPAPRLLPVAPARHLPAQREQDRQTQWNNLKMELRSIALSVGPHLMVTVAQLDKDYSDINGHQIRYFEFGFANLTEMLQAMPDAVEVVECVGGYTAVLPVPNEKTRHLQRLIDNQIPSEPGRLGGLVHL